MIARGRTVAASIVGGAAFLLLPACSDRPTAPSDRVPVTAAATDTWTVSGAVTGPSSDPLVGADVAFASQNGTVVAQTSTDGAGLYSVHVASDTYDVIVVPPAGSGLATATIEDFVVSGSTQLNIQLLPAESGRITGTLVDHTGAPATGALLRVFTSGGQLTAPVGADGSFGVDVADGTYLGRLESTAGGSGDVPDHVWRIRIDGVVVSGATDLGDLTLPEPADLTITVLGPGGQPVAGATVDADYPANVYDVTVGGLQTGTEGEALSNPGVQTTWTTDANGQVTIAYWDGAPARFRVDPPAGFDLISTGILSQTLEGDETFVLVLQSSNVAPEVTRVVLPNDPLPVGVPAELTALFTDENPDDTHTGTFDWGAGPVAGVVTESDGSGSLTLSRAFDAPGVYTVEAVVSDGELDGSRSSLVDEPAYVVVYDPSGSFVTGGGWIDSPAGACTWVHCTAQTTGKASFGFVSKYRRGADVPTGETQFRFKAGDFDFESSHYDWLVVAGARARFKGVGEINGQGQYRFMLTGIDGDAPGGQGVDRFRIKIWDLVTDEVIYDNHRGADETSDASTALGGGSIQVHR